MFWSSIGSGIQPGKKLKPGLGLCRYYNLIVDLPQEAPYFFAALLKADSNYGFNQVEKKSYVGEPITKFWLFASVGETD